MNSSSQITKYLFLAIIIFICSSLADVVPLVPVQRNCLNSFNISTLPIKTEAQANLYSYQVTKDSDIILISISSGNGFSRGISILAAQSLETLINLLNYQTFHTQHQPFNHTVKCDFSYGDSCILNTNGKAVQKETIYLAFLSNVANHQLCFIVQEKESVHSQLEQQIQVIQNEAQAFVAIQSSYETIVRFNNIVQPSGIGQVEVYLLHKDGSLFRDLGGLTSSNFVLENNSNEPIQLLAVESALQNKLIVSQFQLNQQTSSIIIRISNTQVYSGTNMEAISIRFISIISNDARIIQSSETSVSMINQYHIEDFLAFDYTLTPLKGNHFRGYEEITYDFEIEGLEQQNEIKSLKGSFSTKELGTIKSFTSQTRFSLDIQYHNSQGFSSFGRVQLVLSFSEPIPENKPIVFLLHFSTQSIPINENEEKEQMDTPWEIIGIIATCGLFVLLISGTYFYIKRKSNEGRILMKNEEQVEEITEDIKKEEQNKQNNDEIPNINEFNVNNNLEKDQKSKKKPLSTKSSTKSNGENIKLEQQKEFQNPKIISLELEQNTERKLKYDTAQNTNRDWSKNNIDNSQNLQESIFNNPNNEENIFNNLLQSSNQQLNHKTLRFKANKEHLKITIEENPKKKKASAVQNQPNLVLPPKKALSNHKSDENVNNHSI